MNLIIVNYLNKLANYVEIVKQKIFKQKTVIFIFIILYLKLGNKTRKPQ